jgi:hypothetical protein
MTSYHKADGTPLVSSASSGLALLSTVTCSATQNIDFTGLDGTYSDYVLVLSGLIPTGTGTFIKLRTSTNNGSSYDSGASDYSWSKSQNHAAVGVDAADTFIALSDSIGADDVSGVIWLYGLDTANRKIIKSDITCIVAANAIEQYATSGFRISDTAVNAIRLYVDDGSGGAKTIASGKIRLYGVKK